MSVLMLLQWWNLLYIVPFFLAIVYLALYVFTGLTFGDADADAELSAEADAAATVHVEAHVVDTDADVDGEIDSDLDADGDADADADADGDADGDGDTDSDQDAAVTHAHAVHAAGHDGAYSMSDLLSLLGVGKIPISLAFMILFLCWGVSGILLNTLVFNWLGPTPAIVLVTLPLALIISLTITGSAAAIIGKIIPRQDGARERKQDLVGKSGEAIFDIDATFGMAGIRGNAGDLLQVPCRTAEGKPRIPKGSRVVLFHYDREEGVFHVAPFDA